MKVASEAQGPTWSHMLLIMQSNRFSAPWHAAAALHLSFTNHSHIDIDQTRTEGTSQEPEEATSSSRAVHSPTDQFSVHYQPAQRKKLPIPGAAQGQGHPHLSGCLKRGGQSS